MNINSLKELESKLTFMKDYLILIILKPINTNAIPASNEIYNPKPAAPAYPEVRILIKEIALNNKAPPPV